MTRLLIGALACVGLAMGLLGCGDDDEGMAELETVEELVDEHNAAWVDTDPDQIAQFYAEGGVFMDTFRREYEGRTEITALADQWGYLITDAVRTGPLERVDETTYAFPMELVHDGQALSGEITATVQDGEFIRYVWAEGGPNPQAGN